MGPFWVLFPQIWAKCKKGCQFLNITIIYHHEQTKKTIQYYKDVEAANISFTACLEIVISYGSGWQNDIQKHVCEGMHEVNVIPIKGK